MASWVSCSLPSITMQIRYSISLCFLTAASRSISFHLLPVPHPCPKIFPGILWLDAVILMTRNRKTKGDLFAKFFKTCLFYERNAGNKGFKLATPISNGGLIVTPPGSITGSARGGFAITISTGCLRWRLFYFVASPNLSFSSCSRI